MDSNSISDILDNFDNSLNISNLRLLNEEILNMQLIEQAHKNEIKFYKNIVFLSSKIIEEIEKIDKLLVKVYFTSIYVNKIKEIYNESLNKLEEINDKDFCFLNLNKCNNLLKIYERNEINYKSSNFYDLEKLIDKIKQIQKPNFNNDSQKPFITFDNQGFMVKKTTAFDSALVFLLVGSVGIIVCLFSFSALFKENNNSFEKIIILVVAGFLLLISLAGFASASEFNKSDKIIQKFNSDLLNYNNNKNDLNIEISKKIDDINLNFTEFDIIYLKFVELEDRFNIRIT